jgi:hypothetical protein
MKRNKACHFSNGGSPGLLWRRRPTVNRAVDYLRTSNKAYIKFQLFILYFHVIQTLFKIKKCILKVQKASYP